MNKQKNIVLSDFNGTISLSNIAELLLRKFANKKWIYYDDLYLEGKISLDDAIISEYSLIKQPKEMILEEVDRKYQIRPYFTNFIEYCSKNNIPFIIVTSGLDFVIKHILHNLGIDKDISLVSVTTKVNLDNSFQVKGPERFDHSKKDFKSDHVSHYKHLGYQVIYIGDSYSDFYAGPESDIVFSIRGSKLSAYCKEKKISFIEFNDFNELIEIMRKVLT